MCVRVCVCVCVCVCIVMFDNKWNLQKKKENAHWNQDLKLTALKEDFEKSKEHFKNLLGISAESTNNTIEEIVNGQLDIKLEYVTEEELNAEK